MTVSEKVAYLKGLTQGLDLDENDKVVKVLNAIIDTLDEVAEAMGELELDVVDISDQVDAVDEDLADLEDFIYEDDFDEDDEEELYEIKCPECEKTMVVDIEALEEGIECECGAFLELEVDEIEE